MNCFIYFMNLRNNLISILTLIFMYYIYDFVIGIFIHIIIINSLIFVYMNLFSLLINIYLNILDYHIYFHYLILVIVFNIIIILFIVYF